MQIKNGLASINMQIIFFFQIDMKKPIDIMWIKR